MSKDERIVNVGSISYERAGNLETTLVRIHHAAVEAGAGSQAIRDALTAASNETKYFLQENSINK